MTKEQKLIEASANGHLEVVRELLKAGAGIHAIEDVALRRAASNGHPLVVRELIKAGADIHACQDQALRWAARNGHLPVVQELLKAGADIHACQDQALQWAAQNGHLQVKDLLQNTSDLALLDSVLFTFLVCIKMWEFLKPEAKTPELKEKLLMMAEQVEEFEVVEQREQLQQLVGG